MHNRLPPKGMYSGSHDLFKFCKISNNTSEMVQDRYSCNWSKYEIVCNLSNGTIANGLKWPWSHYWFETFVSHTSREIQHVLSVQCLHMNRKARVACNYNYHFKNEGLLKITASHVHCKCGNIWETVPDRVAVTRPTCQY